MIAKYRPKNTFMAVKLEPDNQLEVVAFLEVHAGGVYGGPSENMLLGGWSISWGKNGEKVAHLGDYIARRGKGDCIPIPELIFDKIYERIGRGALKLEK